MINLMVIHLVICVKCSINSTSVEQQKERTLPKTMKRERERVNLREDSHQKKVEEEEEKSDKKDKKEEEKEEKVNL